MNHPKLTYTSAQSPEDLHQILTLQLKNLKLHLTPDQIKQDGYVTIHHTFAQLDKLNQTAKHIIAKDGDKVVAYCLAMTAADRELIPIIVLEFRGKRVAEYKYIVGGQVCVDEKYRGKGVFKGLLDFYRKSYGKQYDFVITEIALDNGRSIKAHQKQGFIEIKRYTQGQVEWSIVVWPWREIHQNF